MKPSTVGELIAQLQKLDPSTLVETEGYSCTGPWSGALEERGSGAKKFVVVGRDDSRDWPPNAGVTPESTPPSMAESSPQVVELFRQLLRLSDLDRALILKALVGDNDAWRRTLRVSDE